MTKIKGFFYKKRLRTIAHSIRTSCYESDSGIYKDSMKQNSIRKQEKLVIWKQRLSPSQAKAKN